MGHFSSFYRGNQTHIMAGIQRIGELKWKQILESGITSEWSIVST